MITVIDFGAGNLKSVTNALRRCGQPYEVTDDPDDIHDGDTFVVPGVGAAGPARDRLRERELDLGLAAAIARGAPVLGICLGMQLFVDRLEEQDTAGLGIIAGNCRRLGANASDLRIPHMGWNTVRFAAAHPLFRGIAEGTYFYFDHTYAVVLAPETPTLAICRYGAEFAAAIGAGRTLGVQFHPEKSGAAGLRVLENFGALAKAWHDADSGANSDVNSDADAAAERAATTPSASGASTTNGPGVSGEPRGGAGPSARPPRASADPLGSA